MERKIIKSMKEYREMFNGNVSKLKVICKELGIEFKNYNEKVGKDILKHKQCNRKDNSLFYVIAKHCLTEYKNLQDKSKFLYPND